MQKLASIYSKQFGPGFLVAGLLLGWLFFGGKSKAEPEALHEHETAAFSPIQPIINKPNVAQFKRYNSN